MFLRYHLYVLSNLILIFNTFWNYLLIFYFLHNLNFHIILWNLIYSLLSMILRLNRYNISLILRREQERINNFWLSFLFEFRNSTSIEVKVKFKEIRVSSHSNSSNLKILLNISSNLIIVWIEISKTELLKV